jgi:hypothetical protein
MRMDLEGWLLILNVCSVIGRSTRWLGWLLFLERLCVASGWYEIRRVLGPWCGGLGMRIELEGWLLILKVCSIVNRWFEIG